MAFRKPLSAGSLTAPFLNLNMRKQKMVHSVVAHIASLFRSARGLELRGPRETSFPSPTRKRQGLTSAIPAGTSFSKLRVADVPRAERDELIRF